MDMKFKTKAAAVVAGAVALLATAVVPAHAYPPGQAIALSVGEMQIARGTSISVATSQAKPGVVTLKFGAVVKRTVASAAGTTPAIAWAPSAAGIYVVRATGSNNEYAQTKIYVPGATAPTSARVGAVARVTVRYAVQGSVVDVAVGNNHYIGVVGKTSTASVPFTVPATGINNVVVTVGQVTLTTLKVTGK